MTEWILKNNESVLAHSDFDRDADPCQPNYNFIQATFFLIKSSFRLLSPTAYDTTSVNVIDIPIMTIVRQTIATILPTTSNVDQGSKPVDVTNQHVPAGIV